MMMFHKPFGKMTNTGKAVVTHYERALIDDALKAGRVTVCEPGTSGLPSYKWNGGLQRLETIDGKTAKEVRNLSFKNYQESVSRRARMRRTEVAALIAEGRSLKEIAALRGESYVAIKNVSKDIRKDPELGAKLVESPAGRGGRKTAVQWAKREADVRALMKKGLGVTKIAAALNISRDAARIAATRVTAATPEVKFINSAKAVAAANRAKVEALLKEGKARAEIMAATGLSASFTSKIMSDLKKGAGA